jgi:hypothetical protein
MLLGFDTEDNRIASAALLVYAIYRSRDKRRGPSGTDMWGQIERFARAAAKRADTVGDFLTAFKRRMACATINPRWCNTGIVAGKAVRTDTGEIMVFGDEDDSRRDFMVEIVEAQEDEQSEIVEAIYEQTQRVVLLVRDRLEREKPIESKFEEVVAGG